MAESRPGVSKPRRVGGDGEPEVFMADEQQDLEIDLARWQNLALDVLRAEGVHRGDGIRGMLFQIKNSGVKQQGKVFLRAAFFQQNGVKDKRVALAVTVEVLLEDFIHDSSLSGPTVVVPHVGSGTEDPEAHFTRGIAPKHGAILDKHGFEPLTSCGDGGTGSGEAAADDDEIRIKRFGFEGAVFSSGLDDHCFLVMR